MSQRDYYEILGIDKNADEAKIKKAYKRLAMKYHPDRNKGDKAGAEKKFKEAVLCSKEYIKAGDIFQVVLKFY